jgi:hypothetical protein
MKFTAVAGFRNWASSTLFPKFVTRLLHFLHTNFGNKRVLETHTC